MTDMQVTGLLIRSDGTTEVVSVPRENSLPAMRELIGCEYIDVVNLNNEGSIFLDDEGGPLMRTDAVFNQVATFTARALAGPGYNLYGNCLLLGPANYWGDITSLKENQIMAVQEVSKDVLDNPDSPLVYEREQRHAFEVVRLEDES